MRRIRGIQRARRAAAVTLLETLKSTEMPYAEKDIETGWLRELRRRPELFPFGWYQPPPNGISVLIGSPPGYERLEYDSLREKGNWPSDQVRSSAESVLYPYLSAIDRRTGMIGDFVGTFYGGKNAALREWIADVYHGTLKIADFAKPGKRLNEVYAFAQSVMSSLGGRNNTLSLTAGSDLGADIGHTIPGYAAAPSQWDVSNVDQNKLVQMIAGAREFVSATNEHTIDGATAFTIEPQMIRPGLPMASFHMIVAFDGADRVIIEEFDDLFEFFGMDDWIAARRKS